MSSRNFILRFDAVRADMLNHYRFQHETNTELINRMLRSLQEYLAAGDRFERWSFNFKDLGQGNWGDFQVCSEGNVLAEYPAQRLGEEIQVKVGEEVAVFKNGRFKKKTHQFSLQITTENLAVLEVVKKSAPSHLGRIVMQTVADIAMEWAWQIPPDPIESALEALEILQQMQGQRFKVQDALALLCDRCSDHNAKSWLLELRDQQKIKLSIGPHGLTFPDGKRYLNGSFT